MQCAEGCSVETTWQVGKDLQAENNKHSVFEHMGTEKKKSTNLKSSKRLRSHANTIRNASLQKMFWTQNPGNVIETTTWRQKKT